MTLVNLSRVEERRFGCSKKLMSVLMCKHIFLRHFTVKIKIKNIFKDFKFILLFSKCLKIYIFSCIYVFLFSLIIIRVF